MNPQSKYSEKLRDPRWQKTRLEVMQRDGFACQRCFDVDSTLNVHHIWYERGKDPWDYPMECFITLCESCHADETTGRPAEEALLLRALQHQGFLASDINDIACAIGGMTRKPNGREITASVISWAIEHIVEINYLYFERLMAEPEKKESTNGVD